MNLFEEDIHDLLDRIMIKFGESVARFVLENCSSEENIFGHKQVVISSECVYKLIAHLEELKVFFDAQEKEEAEKRLLAMNDLEVKRWFAIGKGLLEFEIERMTLFEIINKNAETTAQGIKLFR